MHSEIQHRGGCATLRLVLQSGEQVLAESGAMMYRSPGLSLETMVEGGWAAVAQLVWEGSSFLLNRYTATSDAQVLVLAPSAPGDVNHVSLGEGRVVVRESAILATSTGMTLASLDGDASPSIPAVTLLRCSGEGDLWLWGFGGIQCIELKKKLTVTSRYLVGFDDGLQLEVLHPEDEALGQCTLSGVGRVWLQSRSGEDLAERVHPFRSIMRD